MMNAFDAAASTRRENELRRELEEVFASQNESGDPGETLIRPAYPRVTVDCP